MTSKVTDLTEYKTEKAQNHEMFLEAASLGARLYSDIRCFVKKYGEPEDTKAKDYIDRVMTMLFTSFTGSEQWITLYELHLILEKVGQQRQHKTVIDALSELIWNGRFLDNDQNY